MVAENVAFGILAFVMIVGALRVVTSPNVIHAALYLVIVLAGAAAIYVLLAAEFVAVVQVLVYIGAIIVLFLFGIMMTRAPIGTDVGLDNDQRWLAALVGLFLLGVMAAVLIDAFQDRKVHFGTIQRTAQVADSIFSSYVIPFEVASVLLLAALVGAVAIARRD